PAIVAMLAVVALVGIGLALGGPKPDTAVASATNGPTATAPLIAPPTELSTIAAPSVVPASPAPSAIASLPIDTASLVPATLAPLLSARRPARLGLHDALGQEPGAATQLPRRCDRWRFYVEERHLVLGHEERPDEADRRFRHGAQASGRRRERRWAPAWQVRL